MLQAWVNRGAMSFYMSENHLCHRAQKGDGEEGDHITRHSHLLDTFTMLQDSMVTLFLFFVLRQDFAMQPRLASNSKSSCLCQLSARITSMSLYTWLSYS
jgi:hypothetical protein